ncbi:MAG: metallohydrolase [Verrucomicrobia bacterium]|nr:MAG: metallohydrolase [Verrucomicrobiota bacterium]
MKFRHTAFALLYVTLLVSLTTGCAEAADPLPDAQAHILKNGFRNTNPAFTPPSTWVRMKFIGSRSWATTFHPRSADLPRIENDGSALKNNRTAATVTWVGHSTLLIQLEGVNILTVLISHDHYDHLDVETVRRLAQIHHPLFLVPLGLKAWFAGIGITEVEELDWWESRRIKTLTVTCLPAQHFSGRTLWDRNQRLWSSWAVAGDTKRIFFAGDTGYYPVFKEIGNRLGPFDLAAIPIGAYLPRVMMKMTHMTPEEALQLFADIQGQRFVAIHWGTFDLTEEPIEEPPQRLEAEAKRLGLDRSKVWVLKHGETRGW